ncbi:hypothetical protein ACEPPN_002120 [Leptodophora sp. 'Broadleaf-Isolate-01']
MSNTAGDYHGQGTPAPGSMRAILLKNTLDIDLVTSASTGERITDDIKRQIDENTQLLGVVWDVEHAQAISRDQQTRQLVKSTADAAKIQQQDVIERILYFEYAKRPVARLPPLILARHQTTKVPIWAYIDRTWTSAARRERFTAGKKSWSFATKNIKAKQELAIDPVYIAILITLAQLRRRHDPQESKIHCVTLFVPEHESILKSTTAQLKSDTTIEPRKCQRLSKQTVTKLVQYTANIPHAYLQKLEEPYKFYNATLQVEKRTLPTNEPAKILAAMKTAFHGIDECWGSPLLAYNSKRKPLGELDLNTEDQKRETKRKKV